MNAELASNLAQARTGRTAIAGLAPSFAKQVAQMGGKRTLLLRTKALCSAQRPESAMTVINSRIILGIFCALCGVGMFYLDRWF